MALNDNKKTGDKKGGYYLDVNDYYDKIHHTTWARRTSGMMAGATLGTIYGSAIGAVAFFIPHVLTALTITGAAFTAPTWVGFGATVAMFASTAAFIGMVINTDVSVNAASTSAGMEEKEIREKEEGLYQGNGNGKALENASALTRKEAASPPLFNWKIAAFCAPLFAAFGALIAPQVSHVLFENSAVFSELLGKGAEAGALTPAAVVASASILGLFGMVLGVRNSDISNRLSNFYYKMATGQFFDKPPAPELVVQPEQEITLRPAASPEMSPSIALNQEPQRAGKFASEKLRFSLQNIIQNEDRSAPDIVPGR